MIPVICTIVRYEFLLLYVSSFKVCKMKIVFLIKLNALFVGN